MFNVKNALVLLILSFITTGAGSVTIHPEPFDILGPASGISNPDIILFNKTFQPGVVDDIFLFDINTGGLPSTAAASVTSISMTSTFSSFGPVTIFEIPDFQFALTDENGVAITTFASTGQSVLIDSVLSGTYGIWVKGNASGMAGGSVSGPIALSSVPIPAAVWLFGSALIGFLRLRKKAPLQ